MIEQVAGISYVAMLVSRLVGLTVLAAVPSADSSARAAIRALPRADAAVHHVDRLLRAVQLEQADGHRRALTRAADRGDRLVRVEAVRDALDVVIRRVNGARDVA